MNTFRLFQKYHFPIAVPVSRPCRAAADGSPRSGGGLSSEGRGGLTSCASNGLRVAESPYQRKEASTIFSIVLVDDHAMVRQTLKRLLNQQADLHLAGETDNGLESLSLVKRLQPDLLVTDLMMPGMNGLEVARRVRLSFPATRIVVVSVNTDAPYVAAAFRCGADAFVAKPSCGQHLIAAVRAALAGQRYVSPPLAEPEF